MRGQTLDGNERAQFLQWAAQQTPSGTPQNIRTLIHAEVQANANAFFPRLSDVTNQLGLIVAGEFRSGNGKSPGDGFTGGRFGWPGFTYDSASYFLAGVENDVLQVGLSLADGRVYAGEGNVVLTDAGIVIKAGDGTQSFLSFYNGAGTVEQFAFKTTNGNMQILNQVEGATTALSSLLSDASSPDIIWGEHNSIAGVSRLQVNASSVAPTLAVFGGSGIALWANSDGKETVFNDTSYDINFRVEGATNPYVFVVDAGNNRVEFKNASDTAVHIIDPTGTTYFNEPGHDVDFIVKDDANAEAIKVDAGAGTVSVYGTTLHPPVQETNTNLIFGVSASPGGASTFAGTIASKSGATVTYNVTSGTEGAMKPSATTHLAKMRLYNTTRGDYALISDVNTATNVITLTATVPAAWAATDVITIASQTVSGDGLGWCDLELTSGPTGKSALFVQLIIISATVGDAARITPFDGSYSSSKSIATFAQAVSINSTMFGFYPLNTNIITISWTGTPTNVLIRESGYLA